MKSGAWGRAALECFYEINLSSAIISSCLYANINHRCGLVFFPVFNSYSTRSCDCGQCYCSIWRPLLCMVIGIRLK